MRNEVLHCNSYMLVLNSEQLIIYISFSYNTNFISVSSKILYIQSNFSKKDNFPLFPQADKIYICLQDNNNSKPGQ